MNCSRTRDRLLAGEGAAAVERHLADCPDCRAFAERAEEVLAALQEHDARATPDAGFAARVVAALPAPADPFAWAAARLLPATAALALVLTAWCLIGAPAPAELVEGIPSDDPLSWLLEADAGEAGS